MSSFGASAQPTAPRALVAVPSADFRKGREEAWRELESLIDTAERRGVRALDADELERLPTLYRVAVSSLSVARAIALDRNLLRYLEALALRAYFIVYAPKVGALESIEEFLKRGFPRAVRANLGLIGVSAALVASGIATGVVLALNDPSWISMLTPSDLAGGRGEHSTADELRDHELFAPWPGILESFALFANYLFTHNTGVAILTFALGVAGGAPTFVLLIYQGMVLGAFAALHYERGLLVDFLAWVSIHGVTEIGAIVLCGAAGLGVAASVLAPGRYSRLESLSRHGREASSLVCGAVLMLFVAAILEGVFRQLIGSTFWRFVFAGATASVWFCYFALAGRTRADE